MPQRHPPNFFDQSQYCERSRKILQKVRGNPPTNSNPQTPDLISSSKPRQNPQFHFKRPPQTSEQLPFTSRKTSFEGRIIEPDVDWALTQVPRPEFSTSLKAYASKTSFPKIQGNHWFAREALIKSLILTRQEALVKSLIYWEAKLGLDSAGFSNRQGPPNLNFAPGPHRTPHSKKILAVKHTVWIDTRRT